MLGKNLFLAALACLLSSAVALGQRPSKPDTNDDVVALVKGHLCDSIIVNAIQSQVRAARGWANLGA